MSADQTPANRARLDSADLDSAESATAGGAHGAGESSELSNESPSGHGAAVGQTAATAGSDRTVASAWSLPGAYRLGILQILVWTLLSAVLASLVQPGFASTPTPTSFEWHYRVFAPRMPSWSVAF